MNQIRQHQVEEPKEKDAHAAPAKAKAAVPTEVKKWNLINIVIVK